MDRDSPEDDAMSLLRQTLDAVTTLTDRVAKAETLIREAGEQCLRVSHTLIFFSHIGELLVLKADFAKTNAFPFSLVIFQNSALLKEIRDQTVPKSSCLLCSVEKALDGHTIFTCPNYPFNMDKDNAATMRHLCKGCLAAPAGHEDCNGQRCPFCRSSSHHKLLCPQRITNTAVSMGPSQKRPRF